MFEIDEMEEMSWEQFEEEMENMSWEQFENWSGFRCWEDVMADYCGEQNGAPGAPYFLF